MMKLDFEQIQAITKGTAYLEETEFGVRFYRFTKEQEAIYEDRKGDWGFYKLLFATAGVRLEFVTDSKKLFLKFCAESASSREFFNFDISVNGEIKHTMYSHLAFSEDLQPTVEGLFDLGEGEKNVCVYFPWSVAATLLSCELDDSAIILPIEHKRRILFFGDSIVQGYDAPSPSIAYTSVLTDALDAEGMNKGLAGEKFSPSLACCRERNSFIPDIVLVSFGTNDWRRHTKEQFDKNCEAFFNNISSLYPMSKIFALTPLWRGTVGLVRPAGRFEYVGERIKEVASKLPNITVIDCTDFIPHEVKYFSPDVLHPNALGFKCFARNLIQEIENYL